MVEYDNITYKQYRITDEWLIDEAYYQLERVADDEGLNDNECDQLIRRMLVEADRNFADWLDNNRVGETILDAIHGAVWDYVDSCLTKYLIEREED